MNTYANWISCIFVFGYGGAVGGIGGHDLFHRKESINKFMGTLPFIKFLNANFYLEHIDGHHKRVATKEDPATAKKGENIYAFVVRSVT